MPSRPRARLTPEKGDMGGKMEGSALALAARAPLLAAPTNFFLTLINERRKLKSEKNTKKVSRNLLLHRINAGKKSAQIGGEVLAKFAL
jgi:hypothetical protein